jgi:hypothetical protein
MEFISFSMQIQYEKGLVGFLLNFELCGSKCRHRFTQQERPRFPEKQ